MALLDRLRLDGRFPLRSEVIPLESEVTLELMSSLLPDFLARHHLAGRAVVLAIKARRARCGQTASDFAEMAFSASKGCATSSWPWFPHSVGVAGHMHGFDPSRRPARRYWKSGRGEYDYGERRH